MRVKSSDREVFAVSSLVFAFLALVLAFGALATAAHAISRSNDQAKQIAKMAGAGLIGNTANITLQEYSITAHPGLVQAGNVKFEVHNAGGMTHELVIFRAANAAALPRVKKAGERSVGAIDEAAVAATDKMGETGDVKVGATVVKTFALTPGTYVMFCNIDNQLGGTAFNHFTHGMVATLTVV